MVNLLKQTIATNNMITELNKNEIFVFGSNMAGKHAGGAAKFAKDNFGAEEGVGEGITGKNYQCYAFPTLNENFEQYNREILEIFVKRLYRVCNNLTHKKFLLTPVGTGIAGYSVEFMKSLFKNHPFNLILPKEFL